MLSPSSPVQQLAAVDIGSKAVRMVLGNFNSEGHLQIQQRWRAFLSLGASVFRDQSIPGAQILEWSIPDPKLFKSKQFNKIRDMIKQKIESELL